MSIQYNVAAALMLGGVTERNFALLADAELHRLIGVMTLQVDDAMTRAYPGLQGGEVEVREAGGSSHRMRLDNVVNASALDVKARFRAATQEVFGAGRAIPRVSQSSHRAGVHHALQACLQGRLQ